jgi:high-affinity K+ transport system ATPase subunit B
MTPNGVLQITIFFLIIFALTKPMGAASLLRRNVLIYGLGGIIVPAPTFG